jgi:hypothetical protein
VTEGGERMNEEMFKKIMPRLQKEYEKKLRHIYTWEHLKDQVQDEHWVVRQHKIMRFVQKNFEESCILLRDGSLPPKFIMSESRRKVERELLGRW